ncbi:MAG TPA: hypothetical protein VK624_21065 [Steroidobacteraceae bacterium]|nr:hypothetical protein [Steroidobacteraceae bacterium]
MTIETRPHPNETPGGDFSDALRANLLQLVHARFGERIAEMVSRSLGDAPITARDAQAILRAAAKLSDARERAYTSAGVKPADFVWAQRDRPRAPDARHRRLLDFCAEVIRKRTARPADPARVARAAELLHDSVRAYLEKRGRWPILDTSELELHGKPVALTLASWTATDV